MDSCNPLFMITNSPNNSLAKLLLIDAHALIYRAFYAFPDHLTDAEGKMVNAVYGFTRILLNVLRDFEPEYLAIAFDHKDKTFRAKAYTDYKANRSEMPDELKPQIEMVKNVVDALNIPRFEISGFEADDLIGSLSKQASQDQKSKIKNQKLQVVVVTGDKDLLQLVTDQVHVFIPSRSKKYGDIEYDPEKVKEIIGIRPDQVPEVKALMGDASDNIPGIKGVGKKTAAKLIQVFGNIDELYKILELKDEGLRIKSDPANMLKGALLNKLIAGKNDAFMSRELATIQLDAPIKLDLPACKLTGYDKTAVVKLFEVLGFKSLVSSLPADEFEIGVQNALF